MIFLKDKFASPLSPNTRSLKSPSESSKKYVLVLKGASFKEEVKVVSVSFLVQSS
ncbi:MAG: hypothetical protein JJ846_008840 [Prochlorococcus marinus CUG1437]|nr:hypothetical protein [Prochlorococcus marinus CUG1437]